MLKKILQAGLQKGYKNQLLSGLSIDRILKTPTLIPEKK